LTARTVQFPSLSIYTPGETQEGLLRVWGWGGAHGHWSLCTSVSKGAAAFSNQMAFNLCLLFG